MSSTRSALRAKQDETTSSFTRRLRKLRQQWLRRTGIDWETYKLISKGALAPTIALACCETQAFNRLFGDLGYLVPLTALLCYPMPPRSQFLQVLVLNTVFACVSAAVMALVYYCMIKARSPQGQDGYDSSGSAVAGVWLAVQVFITTGLRFISFQMIWPCSVALIFSNFGIVFAIQFGELSSCLNLLRQLLLAHLIGFSISAGVALLVFPRTNRREYFDAIMGCGKAMKSTLFASVTHLHSVAKEGEEPRDSALSADTASQAVIQESRSLAGLQVRLGASLKAAQLEVAVGQLDNQDLRDIHDHIIAIITPLISMGRLSEMIRRQSSNLGQVDCEAVQYRRLLSVMEAAFSEIAGVTGKGIEHVLITLNLTSKKDHAKDEELYIGMKPSPGMPNFASLLNHHIHRLLEERARLIEAWKEGIENTPESNHGQSPSALEHLNVLLYTEFLLWSTARRVLDLVLLTDEMKASGKLSRRRFIAPGYDRCKKLLRGPCSKGYSFNTADRIEDYEPFGEAEMEDTVIMGSRDPMHAPPVTRWERWSDSIRIASQWFGSSDAGFALRVTLATLSAAIVLLLKDTQAWYIQEHLVWCQYTVAFAMQTSTGQQLRGFLLRFLATVLAVLLAWFSWYVPWKHPAGVIIFYWVFMHLPMYFMLKVPRLFSIGIISSIAFTIVLGSELHARQFGGKVEPIYLLGAVRLTAITAGMFIGLVWGILPIAKTQRDLIRRTLGLCLLSLAKFQSISQEKIQSGMADEKHRPGSSSSSSRRQEKKRSKLFAECTGHLQSVRAQLGLVKYDVPVGGKFPSEAYQTVITNIDALVNSVQMLSFTSSMFDTYVSADDRKEIVPFLEKFADSGEEANREKTTVLVLLANAVIMKAPLPPYITLRKPAISKALLDQGARDYSSTQMVANPGQSTLAVMHIGNEAINDHLRQLLQTIKELVGEIDLL